MTSLGIFPPVSASVASPWPWGLMGPRKQLRVLPTSLSWATWWMMVSRTKKVIEEEEEEEEQAGWAQGALGLVWEWTQTSAQRCCCQ